MSGLISGASVPRPLSGERVSNLNAHHHSQHLLSKYLFHSTIIRLSSMVALSSLAVITIILCSLTPAVIIRNYEERNCRVIRGRIAACRNAAEHACCDNRPGRTYSSSKFIGLPPTAIGYICTHYRGQNCGLVRDSGHGLSLCLNYPNSRGASWFDCRSCRRPNQLSDLELAIAHKAKTPQSSRT